MISQLKETSIYKQNMLRPSPPSTPARVSRSKPRRELFAKLPLSLFLFFFFFFFALFPISCIARLCWNFIFYNSSLLCLYPFHSSYSTLNSIPSSKSVSPRAGWRPRSRLHPDLKKTTFQQVFPAIHRADSASPTKRKVFTYFLKKFTN